MTIDELVMKYSKIPGDIKLQDENLIGVHFTPYCRDTAHWHGLNENNVYSAYLGNRDRWQLYTKPKKKIKLYRWLTRNTVNRGYDDTVYCRDREEANRRVNNVNIEILHRLDETMIEVDEE